MIIGILQNAYGGPGWSRCVGNDLLINRGRAGTPSMKRLLKIVKTSGLKWWFDNATAKCGRRSSDKFTADLDHIRWVLRRPHTHVVAFGKVAEEACLQLELPVLLCVPHPASRTVTNDLYIEMNKMLNEGFTGRLAIRQRMFYTEVESV